MSKLVFSFEFFVFRKSKNPEQTTLNQKGFVPIIVIILLLVAIGIGVYLINNPQIFSSKASAASEIQRLNEKITAQVQKNQAKFASDINASRDVVDLVKSRQALLLAEIPKSAEVLLENSLSEEVLQSLPKEALGFIEQKVEKAGRLQVIHTDNFQDKKSANSYQFKSGDETFEAYIPYGNSFVNQREVKISGLQLQDKLVPEEMIPLSTQTTVEPSSKILVAPVNFKNLKHQQEIKDELQNIMFAGRDSVKEFYKGQSRAGYIIGGEVKDAIEIPFDFNESKCGENYFNWIKHLDSNLPELSSFNTVIYVFPTSACFMNGGYISGLFMSDVPDKVLIFGQDSRISTIIHELGHGLGLPHADSLFCQDKYNFALFRNGCYYTEYGDFTSIMGTGRLPVGFNAPELEYLGWLPKEEILDPGRGGSGYNIFGLDAPYDGLKAVKMVRKVAKPFNWANQFLYISYPINSNIDPTYRGGAVMMIAGMYNGGAIPTPTILIPAQTSIGAALMDSDTFYDKLNNIDVTQTFHTPVMTNVIVAARSIKDKYGVNLRFYLENNPPLDNRKFPIIITAKSDVSNELKNITDGVEIRSVVGKDNSYVITADTSIYYLSMIAFIADVTSLDMSEKLNLTGLASCRVEWDGVNDILAENTILHPVIKTNGKLQYVSVYLDDKKVNGGEMLSGGSYRWEVNSGKKGLHKLSFKMNDWEGYGISGQNAADTRVCVPTVIFETIDEKERKQIGLPATKCEVEWDGISSEYSENTPFTVKGKVTSSEVGKGYITVYMDGKAVEGGKIVGEGFEWDVNSQGKGDHVIQLKVNDWERYKISGQDESLSQFCGGELNFTTR